MIKELLKRPVGVTMSVVAIVVLCIVAMGYLPVSLMPGIDIPQITIQASAPGLSVREVDNTILKPLKNQLSQVTGLKNITAEARADAGAIYMDFEPNSNIDIIFIDVNEKLDRAVTALPKDVERPKVIKASITDIPAFYLNLSLKSGAPRERDKPREAGIDFSELGQFARDVIAKRIEQLPQTAMVDISGVVTPELLCIPDYTKLTSMGVDISLLENAINNNNVSLGALSIKDGQYRYSIHFDSRIISKEDIENIYINHNGRIYRFKELCEIVERPAKRNGLVRSGDYPAVTLAIIKQNDAKMADLQESIATLITDLEKEHPDIRFELTRDQTQLLSYSINNLSSNLLIGAILAALIIFLFMKDLRSPVLIVITIPLSLMVTLLAFHVLDISLNIISLSGLILGTGMMVDNSIIVIDNIFQKWRSDMRIEDAISKAVGEVFTPMLSSVLTTCSVFLPLIFLSGTAGALFYDQAMAVTVALFASLLVSVLVLPVYFYLMYRKLSAHTENRFMAKFFTFNYYRPYEAGLKWMLRHARLMIICFVLLIPLTYFVYQMVEKSRLPRISHDDTILTIDWNSGISLEENDLRVFRLLSQVDSLVLQTTSMVGVQQFLMSHTKEITPSESIIYIKAKDAGTLAQIEQKLSAFIASNYPKAQASFEVSGNIFNMIFAEAGSPLVAEIYSKEGQAPTVEQVTRVVGKIEKALPDVQIPPAVMEQNIRYIADVEAMAMHQVKFSDIYGKMKNMISQNTLFRINQGGYSVPVTTGDTQAEASDILSGKVRNRNGVEIPLSMVIRETKGEDFKKLYSGNGGDYYPIELNVDDRDARQVMETVEKVVNEDKDFYVTFTGEYFSSRETIRELIVILLVAISLLYFILAAQFESVIQPFIILSEIVVDIFFVLLGLWLFGESLNIMSMIGLVVMSGIIINDSILKVDTINRLRKGGMPLLRAVFTAGHSRLKPIIMTSLTTILAIAPFLNRVDMGSDLQYPLSLTIIIGMSVGTLVSLFFVPLIYYVIYRKR